MAMLTALCLSLALLFAALWQIERAERLHLARKYRAARRAVADTQETFRAIQHRARQWSERN